MVPIASSHEVVLINGTCADSLSKTNEIYNTEGNMMMSEVCPPCVGSLDPISDIGTEEKGSTRNRTSMEMFNSQRS